MEQNQLQPNDMVGSYKIIRKIGQGGMGEVYEAWEDVLQRRIALKVLSSEAITKPHLVQRFQAEGRALARLKHVNIVHIYALGEHKGQVYMAMEYIDGWPLDDFLNFQFSGLHEILRLFRQMLEGLAAAHDAGVVHRDIKPQNVMVNRAMSAKLVDFGIAKLHEDHGGFNTVSGMLVGTLNYMAPEIINGGEASKQSDIYSLGLVLYYMLTGNSPFEGKKKIDTIEKVLTSTLKFAPEVSLILPTGLINIIYRMTSKSLQVRYQSAREALAALALVNLENLPRELRPTLGAQMNIAEPELIRSKCKSLGLEFLEIGVVVSLAAQIVKKAQKLGDAKAPIYIGDQALSEAIKGYDSTKKMLMRRQVFSSRGFRVAAIACGASVLIAAIAIITNLGEGNEQVVVKNSPPPAHVQTARQLPKPISPPAPPLKMVPEATAIPRAPVKMAPAKSKPVVVLKPPVPVLPIENAVITASQAKIIKLEWQPRGQARSYEISVRSLNSDFSRTLVSEHLTAKLSELPNGQYTWSIRPLDAQGKRGPRSLPRKFFIKPDVVVQQKPVLLPAVIERRPAGR